MTAWCDQQMTVSSNVTFLQSNQIEIMAIEDENQHIYGVQFHPESLLTEFGHDILRNFLRVTTM